MARAVDDLIRELEQRVAELLVDSNSLRWEPPGNTPVLDQWLHLFRYSSSIDEIFRPVFDIGDRIYSGAYSDEELHRALQIALYNIDTQYKHDESKHDVDLSIREDFLIEWGLVEFVLNRANRAAHDGDCVKVVVNLRTITTPLFTIGIVLELPGAKHRLSGMFCGRQFRKGLFLLLQI